MQEEQLEEALQEDLLRRSILRVPSEPVVRDRDRVYGDCLPKFLQPAIRCVAVTYTRSTRKRCAPNTDMKNVWVWRARQKHISGQGWVGVGG